MSTYLDELGDLGAEVVEQFLRYGRVRVLVVLREEASQGLHVLGALDLVQGHHAHVASRGEVTLQQQKNGLKKKKKFGDQNIFVSVRISTADRDLPQHITTADYDLDYLHYSRS